MKKPLILLSLLLLILLATFAAWPFLARQRSATAAPDVFASAINGGCYIAAPNACKIHVDPFTIDVDDGGGDKLVAFQLEAVLVIGTSEQAFPIYNFKTEADPLYRKDGDYTPSLVAQDFAASCGEDYFIRLGAIDEGDSQFYEVASTAVFTCPSDVP